MSSRARCAVVVDGCFWHGCSDPAIRSKSNRAFWVEKFAPERQRDADTNRLHFGAGGLLLRFSQHEPPKLVADRVEQEWRRWT